MLACSFSRLAIGHVVTFHHHVEDLTYAYCPTFCLFRWLVPHR